MKTPAITALVLSLGSLAIGGELIETSVTIRSLPSRVGEEHHVSRYVQVSGRWKSGLASEFTQRTTKTDLQVTIAAVDTARQATCIRVSYKDPTGARKEQVIAQGRPAPGADPVALAAGADFVGPASKSLTRMHGLRGTIRVGQKLKLGTTLGAIANTQVAQPIAVYLGRDRDTGYAIVEIGFVTSEVDVPVEGAKTRLTWAGRLTFDPHGPRLVGASVEASPEITLPQGVTGEASSVGTIRIRQRLRTP